MAFFWPTGGRDSLRVADFRRIEGAREIVLEDKMDVELDHFAFDFIMLFDDKTLSIVSNPSPSPERPTGSATAGDPKTVFPLR